MTVEIEGVTLHLAHPDELAVEWVGQDELMRQLLAAWMVVNEQDLPMNPRLLGKPGVGKTTLAYAAAQAHGARRLHPAGHPRHAPRRSAGHAGDRRRGQPALRRLAAGHRHDPRRHRHPRRRQPHEREELGQPGAAARQPPLRGIHRGRHQDQGAPAVPAGGHHERRRLHLRAARVHPFAPAAADLHRLSRARRGVPDPAREPALRRRAHPQLRHRLPADGARRRRALHRARRHQRGALRHQAEEPGHRADARDRGAGDSPSSQVLGEEALRYVRRNRPAAS